MKRIITLFAIWAVAQPLNAQVKIGHDAAGAKNPAALLELSNDTAATASPSGWKGLLLPYVDFTDASAFADNTVWGIDGSATDGAVVYNTGSRATDGFDGPGAYVWSDGAWRTLQGTAGIQCTDPGSTAGLTGCVTFTYRGQQLTYTTVRAADNHIWLQQNLGAKQVATANNDTASYGDLFQWGRWDDEHQVKTSTTASATTVIPNNPSGLGTGAPFFFVAAGADLSGPTGLWWQSGLVTNTWTSGAASATNGKDPCTEIGAGWHMASSAEWDNLITQENITNAATAFSSNLKLPAPPYRDHSGVLQSASNYGNYWSATPDPTDGRKALNVNFDGGTVHPSINNFRNFGLSIRCLKN